jgi:hypothetical protein
MAERKVKVTLPDGRPGEGTEVPVAESNERWSEFTFDDGTVIRGKMTISSAVRVDGEFDAQDNPIYVINFAPLMAVVNVPEKYKKGH